MLSEAETASTVASSSFSTARIAATLIQNPNACATNRSLRGISRHARLARRQQPAREGVGDEQQLEAVEHRVLDALQAWVGQVERVERIGDRRSPRSGTPASTSVVQTAASARRNLLGAAIAGSRAMTRRVIQRIGAASTPNAIASPSRLNACEPREPAGDAVQPVVEQSRPAAWRRRGPRGSTLAHSRGLKMLDERSKVWRANILRRAAPMRALLSSICKASARAVRKSASSSS